MGGLTLSPTPLPGLWGQSVSGGCNKVSVDPLSLVAAGTDYPH